MGVIDLLVEKKKHFSHPILTRASNYFFCQAHMGYQGLPHTCGDAFSPFWKSCQGRVGQGSLQQVPDEQAHLAPPEINFLGKLISQNMFNGDHAW